MVLSSCSRTQQDGRCWQDGSYSKTKGLAEECPNRVFGEDSSLLFWRDADCLRSAQMSARNLVEGTEDV